MTLTGSILQYPILTPIMTQKGTVELSTSIYQQVWRDRYPNGAAFKNARHKQILLLGMSGVGKTHVSSRLMRSGWFHFSVDYRIGTRYLSESILDLAKKQMMLNPMLAELLRDDSIYLGLNLTVGNLTALSNFIGMLGDPDTGGVPLDLFRIRQKQYADAERNSMLDIPEFIEKARRIYAYEHFVADATGSLCELFSFPLVERDPILDLIAREFLIVFIDPDAEGRQALIKRQINEPRPMYYNPDFLTHTLSRHLNEAGLASIEKCDPKTFLASIFRNCMDHRQKRYTALSDTFGVTISARDTEAIMRSSNQEKFNQSLIDLIAQAIDKT